MLLDRYGAAAVMCMTHSPASYAAGQIWGSCCHVHDTHLHHMLLEGQLLHYARLHLKRKKIIFVSTVHIFIILHGPSIKHNVIEKFRNTDFACSYGVQVEFFVK